MTKRIYSLEEVKEQIGWHSARVKLLQDRIANGECTEETDPMDPLVELVHGGLMTAGEFLLVGLAQEAVRAGTQDASISHEVGRRATISPPPYPPYGFGEIDRHRSSGK
jgi:hypothetical protein